MGYYIDLSKITTESYKVKLATAYLPPSRMILKERIDERFGYFTSQGIKNVYELLQLLKKKESLSKLQKEDIFAGDYLVILLRELNSMLPKPNKMSDFANIEKDTVAKLEKAGIKDTFKLFDRILNPQSRRELAITTGISENEILILAKLTDLSRIKWVGATFARLLFEAGVDHVKKVTEANAEDLHKKINALNKVKNIFKGNIGLNDMKILVEAAREVPLDVEF